MTIRLPLLLLASAAAVLLTGGCGDDRPDTGPPPGSSYSAPASAAPAAMSVPATDTPPDPLLPSGGGGTISTADPLLSSQNSSQSDSTRDPLASSDPLKGPAMPTDHSHWLTGSVRDARLTVRVNGLTIGEYTGLVDKDITMKLRRGINSVSFTYVPLDAGGSAQIDLVESEHDPPIAPLASFRSQPPPAAATAQGSAIQPITQSFSIFAK